MWSLPLVIGLPPKPCSECTLTDIGQEKAVLLGGTGNRIKFNSMDSLKVLDMSETKSHWVSIVTMLDCFLIALYV